MMYYNDKICVAIPCRNEKYCNETIDSLIGKAQEREKLDICVIIDGWDLSNSELAAQYDSILNRTDIRVINNPLSYGVRVAANRAAATTDAHYFMKTDSHCLFSKGWDAGFKKVVKECGQRTLVIPEMVSWEPETGVKGTRVLDHCLLRRDLTKTYWMDFKHREKDFQVAPNTYEMMCNVGCTWFCETQYWWYIGGHEENFFSWGESGPETSLKVWLSGGRQVLTRDVRFAHYFRRRFPYHISPTGIVQNKTAIREYFSSGSYYMQIHDVNWLFNKFAPVPEDVK